MFSRKWTSYLSAAVLTATLAACGNAPVPNTTSQPGGQPSVIPTVMPTDAPTTPPVGETPSAVGMDTAQVAAEIARYLQLWQTQNITSYSYTIERSCRCLDDARGPVVVEVNGDAMTVTNATTGEPNTEYFNDVDTVDKMFGLLDQQLSNGADQIDVTYDETTGVPQSIFIDVIADAMDEELRYTISSFEQTDGMTTPTAGPETPAGQSATDIARNLQLWQSQNITSYRFTLERICFCVEDARGPVVVEVDGDTVTVTNAATGASGSEFFSDVDSIDKLFALLEQQVNEGAERVEVTYDATTGVPLTINIDKSSQIADEEVRYTLSDFEQTDGTTTQTETPATETPQETAGPTTTETPGAQAPEQTVQTADDIAARRQQWIDRNVTTYRYTIERSCFCTEESRGPVLVEVDGDAATVTNAATGEPGSEFFDDVNTITKIYDLLEKEANEGADEIAVSYDDATGVPVSIRVDKDFQMADEELYYTITNFEVVQQ